MWHGRPVFLKKTRASRPCHCYRNSELTYHGRLAHVFLDRITGQIAEHREHGRDTRDTRVHRVSELTHMSAYQQIPGNIRSLLATKARTWTDHAADLATQYAAMCDETNQRLRRCSEYL